MVALREVFGRKVENWKLVREEGEYQQSLLQQSNAILKRRLAEMEKYLHEKEEEDLVKDREIEKLKEFIGQRKELEQEFEKGFKLMGQRLSKGRKDWKRESLEQRRKVGELEEELRRLALERAQETRRVEKQLRRDRESEKQLERVQQDNRELRRRIEQLKEVEIGSNKTKEQIADEILEMKEHILQFREERKRVQQAMAGMDREGQLMLLENDTMEGYVSALIEDKKQWKEREKRMEREVVEVKLRLEESAEEIAGKEGEIGVLLKVIEEKEAKLAEHKEQVRGLKEKSRKEAREARNRERHLAEQIEAQKGRLEDLQDQFEQERKRADKLGRTVGQMQAQESRRASMFDRVLEKASLIMSKRLSALEKSVFLFKVGKKGEWRGRRDEAGRVLREIENGKLRQLNGVIEYLGRGRGVISQQEPWAELIREDRREFMQLASRALCASASEAVLKGKMRDLREQNEELKRRENRAKWLKEALQKSSQQIQGLVERAQQKKLYSKGWKDQMEAILGGLESVSREIKSWRRVKREREGPFDMMNFFRNLSLIKEISVFQNPETEAEEADPREVRFVRENEEKGVGESVRRLASNRRVVPRHDWAGQLEALKLGGVDRLAQVEVKQMLLLTEKCNQELISENKRLKVRRG